MNAPGFTLYIGKQFALVLADEVVGIKKLRREQAQPWADIRFSGKQLCEAFLRYTGVCTRCRVALALAEKGTLVVKLVKTGAFRGAELTTRAGFGEVMAEHGTFAQLSTLVSLLDTSTLSVTCAQVPTRLLGDANGDLRHFFVGLAIKNHTCTFLSSLAPLHGSIK